VYASRSEVPRERDDLVVQLGLLAVQANVVEQRPPSAPPTPREKLVALFGAA